MPRPDLNLLTTLDALLEERSVARAARRLSLSPSAMSRALARLRAATGDPILARAGRGVVPTPRAAELRPLVARLVEEARAVLRPADEPELATLARTFTIRAGDGFAETFGPALLARTTAEAPGVRIRFAVKTDRSGDALRDGSADLETGIIGPRTAPELGAQPLFQDRFVGAVRRGHPLAKAPATPARYAAARHVAVSRHGSDHGPVDDALEPHGLQRTVAVTVGGFAAALALARRTDLVATIPERHTTPLREGLHTFTLPFDVRPIRVSLLWHPRMEADPAHRWFRRCVRAVCQA